MNGPATEKPGICRAADRFVAAVGDAFAWLSVALVAAIIVQVCLRYVFRWGLAWLDEFQWYLYAAMLMIAIPYGVVHEAHIRMDLLWSRLTPRTKAWIEVGGILCLLLPIAVVVTHHGWSLFQDSWRVGERSPAPTGMPWRWLVKAFLPLGGILLGLAAISRLVAQVACLGRGRGHGAQ
jgi:TRAP-type mannitol/chloroaromatic compound transport system permease small subunit